MSKTKWYTKAIYLFVALAMALGVALAPVVPSAPVVEANSALTCTLSVDDVLGSVNSLLCFNMTASGGTVGPTPGSGYDWSLDIDSDGTPEFTATNDTSPQYYKGAYGAPGLYTATLTVKDYAMPTPATATSTVKIAIVADPFLYPKEEDDVICHQQQIRTVGLQAGDLATDGVSEAGSLLKDWSLTITCGDGEAQIKPYVTGYPGKTPPVALGDHEYMIEIGLTIAKPCDVEITLTYIDPRNPPAEQPGTLRQITAVKEYGEIVETELEQVCGSEEMKWYEAEKTWRSEKLIREKVLGTTCGLEEGKLVPLNGAVIHYFMYTTPFDCAEIAGVSSKVGSIDTWSGTKIIEVFGPEKAAKIFDELGVPPSIGALKHVESRSADIEDFECGLPGPEKGQTVTMGDGTSLLDVVSYCEGVTTIVVVVDYPCVVSYPPHIDEVLTINWWTQELEKVPQVRWAGEEIVLEKSFGEEFGPIVLPFPIEIDDVVIFPTIPYIGVFYLEQQSPGTLESIGAGLKGLRAPIPETLRLVVWADINVALQDTAISTLEEDGIAECLFDSETQGEVDVKLALYEPFLYIIVAGVREEVTAEELGSLPAQALIHLGYRLINKHGFVAFFLKYEGITLGNVEGIRVDNPLTKPVEGHDSGIWAPENPWDTATDMTEQELNVSQDALLRARVKGWFMGDNLSWREESYVDNNHNGVLDAGDTRLPEGRWVLPDDWEYLAGSNWQEVRPHWDIMDQPDDKIVSFPDADADKVEEMGPYFAGLVLKAESPLIGPYSSLDDYTPFTNGLPPTSQPGADSRKTIMPNGELNWWDCPMPPAKIIFEIKNEDGPGFFKQVDKGDVYYELGGTIKSPIVQYTNPFYKIEIPASPLIPPFVNNGGYDWDSFGFNTPYDLKDGYGPYDFWTIFNRPPNPDVPAADANHPTKVEVYSDNHGEAMVWLNGDSRIVLDDAWKAWDAGDVIATTVVQAMADYPYFRKHPVVTSNEVTKDWTWGKDVKLYIESLSPEMPNPVNPTGWKMAWLFVCDRDRFSAVGEQVEWSIAGYGDPQIIGFLEGTDGVLIDKGTATSVTKPCGAAEIAKFEEFFGAGTYPAAPYGYAVAAIKLYNSFALSADLLARVHDPEGVVVRDKMVNFGSGASYDPMLDAPLADCEYLGLYARPLPEALTDIEPYVQAVWYYEDSTGTWMRWIPGDFQGYPNRLDTLVPSKDYLFRLSQNCNWNP